MAEKNQFWYIHIEHRRLVASWRNIGKSEGLETDNQIAKFLINLYHTATNEDSERNFWCIHCKRSPLLLSASQEPPQEPHHNENTNLKCDSVDDNVEAGLPVPELSAPTTSASLVVIKREVDSASNFSVKYDGSDTVDIDRKSGLLVSEQTTATSSKSVPVVKHEEDEEDSASNLSDEISELDVTFSHDSTNILVQANPVKKPNARNTHVQASRVEETSDSDTKACKRQIPANPTEENSDSDIYRNSQTSPDGSNAAEENEDALGSDNQNMNTKKKQSKSIVCSVCRATFTTHQSLRSHMLIHTGEKPYSCPLCGVSFRQKGSMQGHVRHVHSTDRQFQCPYCPRDYKANVSLKKHIRCHHPSKRTFKRKGGPALLTIKPHLKRSGNDKTILTRPKPEGNTVKNDSAVMSDACSGKPAVIIEGKQTGSKIKGVTQQVRGNVAELSISKDSSSTPSDNPACPDLGNIPEANNTDVSSDTWNAPGHLRSDKKKVRAKKQQRKPAVCTVCNATFTARQSLKSHMLIHTGEKPFPCPHCDASFRQRGSMKGHVKHVHSTERPFKCPHCPKDFKDNRRLKKHIRCHQPGPLKRPYKCKECPASFTVKSNLNRHLLIHSSDRPFQCPHCPKDFKDNPHLKMHIEKHHLKNYRFFCEICGKGLYFYYELQKHTALHKERGKEDGPFMCETCGKTFEKLSSLTGHKRTHR